MAGLQVVQKQDQVVQQTMQMFVDETTEGKAFAGVAAVVGSDSRQLDSEGRGVAAAVTTAITTESVTDRELARAIQRNAGVEGASISDRYIRAKLSQARKRRAPDVAKAEWGRTERCVRITVFLKQHSYPDSLPNSETRSPVCSNLWLSGDPEHVHSCTALLRPCFAGIVMHCCRFSVVFGLVLIPVPQNCQPFGLASSNLSLSLFIYLFFFIFYYRYRAKQAAAPLEI